MGQGLGLPLLQVLCMGGVLMPQQFHDERVLVRGGDVMVCND